jgi:hypothetical protein
MTGTDLDQLAEAIARRSHDFYGRHVKANGWSTQESTRVDWDDLPAANRATMLATFKGLLDAGVILPGPAVTEGIEEAE